MASAWGTHSRGYADHEPQRFQAWCQEWATEALRVLRPGGWLLAFGSPRTWHRLTCGIEDAGFELRDQVATYGPLTWNFGAGFPKSVDVGRAIDMHLCVLPGRHCARALPPEDRRRPDDHVCPDTPEGTAWDGYGSAMKPSFEPVCVARKPLSGTLAGNVLAWGTGALNIDGTRLHTPGSEAEPYTVKRLKPGATLNKTGGSWRPDSDDELPWEVGREYQGRRKPEDGPRTWP